MNFKYYYNLYIARCYGGVPPLNDDVELTVHYSFWNRNRAFAYHNMNQQLQEGYDIVECNGYNAFLNFQVRQYIFFQRIHPASNEQGIALSSTHLQSDKGWKFHILLADDQADDNLEQGWVIVKDHLMNHQVELTKIVKEDARLALRHDPADSSKTITIFAFKENKSKDEWQQFIYDVTHALHDAGIRAAPLPHGDLQITNSEFFGYRNDAENFDPDTDPFTQIDANEDLRSHCLPNSFC